MALSSADPILTAFQLSWELRRLARIEKEFTNEYMVGTNVSDRSRTRPVKHEGFFTMQRRFVLCNTILKCYFLRVFIDRVMSTFRSYRFYQRAETNVTTVYVLSSHVTFYRDKTVEFCSDF